MMGGWARPNMTADLEHSLNRRQSLITPRWGMITQCGKPEKRSHFSLVSTQCGQGGNTQGSQIPRESQECLEIGRVLGEASALYQL